MEGRPIDKWILVDNLRRRKIKPILGNRKDDESSLRGVETRKRDTWDIYVGIWWRVSLRLRFSTI